MTCIAKQNPNKGAEKSYNLEIKNVVNLYNNFCEISLPHSPISQSYPQAVSHFVLPQACDANTIYRTKA